MTKTHCRSNPTGHAPPLAVVMKTLVRQHPAALFDFWRILGPKTWIYQRFLAPHQMRFSSRGERLALKPVGEEHGLVTYIDPRESGAAHGRAGGNIQRKVLV